MTLDIVQPRGSLRSLSTSATILNTTNAKPVTVIKNTNVCIAAIVLIVLEVLNGRYLNTRELLLQDKSLLYEDYFYSKDVISKVVHYLALA